MTSENKASPVPRHEHTHTCFHVFYISWRTHGQNIKQHVQNTHDTHTPQEHKYKLYTQRVREEKTVLPL